MQVDPIFIVKYVKQAYQVSSEHLMQTYMFVLNLSFQYVRNQEWKKVPYKFI